MLPLDSRSTTAPSSIFHFILPTHFTPSPKLSVFARFPRALSLTNWHRPPPPGCYNQAVSILCRYAVILLLGRAADAHVCEARVLRACRTAVDEITQRHALGR